VDGLPPDTLEAARKHYSDLFIYQAKQRLDSIRFFLIAVAIAANGIVAAGPSNGAKVIIAFIAGFVTLIFLRLDYRNAKILEVDEKPLSYIQQKSREHFGVSKEWITFDVVNHKNGFLSTYGALIPLLYSTIWFAFFSSSCFFFYRWLPTRNMSTDLVVPYAALIFSLGFLGTFICKPSPPSDVKEV